MSTRPFMRPRQREAQLRCATCQAEFGPTTPHAPFDHADHWACGFCGAVRAWGGEHGFCKTCRSLSAFQGTLDTRRRRAAIMGQIEEVL